jgi:serine/threonine protein kinase
LTSGRVLSHYTVVEKLGSGGRGVVFEAQDARSDLFSLGVVLHEMVTGQQAFTSSTSVVIVDAILYSL